MDPSSLTTPAADDGSAEFNDDASIVESKPAPGTLEAALLPNQPLHAKLLSRLKARTDLSRRHRSQRFDTWDRVDEKRRLYVNLARPARRGDNTVNVNKKEMPFERAIVMPASYAIHETRKSEIFSQYAFRAPFTQLDGRGIEDVKPAKIAEVKLEYDYQESDGPLAVYSVIQDADAYGEGIIYDSWDEVYGWEQQPPDPMQSSISQMFGLAPPEPTNVWQPVKQFTRWSPVDPYLALPDPRVTRGRLQDGEFFGHESFRSFLWLQERSQDNGGNYFNLDELKTKGSQAGGSSTGTGSSDTRLATRSRGLDTSQFQLRESADEKDRGYFVITNLQVKLIPNDWQLGDGTPNDDKPSIWWFSIADERVIIRAHKSAYLHNEFTYAVGEVNYDVHQYSNPGSVEMLDGLQRTVDWLTNSRIENVRKFLNDMLLYAPEWIEEDDILHPGAARWLRYTHEGMVALQNGVDPEKMLRQFKVEDVTGAHFEVSQFLMDMMNKLGSANDTMQGQELPEKRTLGEINNAVSAGSKRLQVTARILDAMVFKPLALRAVSNAQQFYDINQWVRVVGDYAEIDPEALGRIQISRKDLAGNFDYVPMSALTPQDPARMLNVWNTLYGMAISNPALSQPDPIDPTVLDIKSFFKFVARLGGAREVDTFFKALPQMPMQPGAPGPQVVPDDQVQQGVQSGQLVPMQSGYGGGTAQPLGATG